MNNNTVLALSAAFDTVDHRILLQRLEGMFGVRGAALDGVLSYFSERTMRVIIEGKTSDPTELDCSLKEGSLLGPRLYSDYTTPLGIPLGVFK